MKTTRRSEGKAWGGCPLATSFGVALGLSLLGGGCFSIEGAAPQLGPHPQLLERYLVDPRTPHNSITAVGVADSEIPDASSVRWRLQAGGQVGLVRWEAEERTWQLDGEAGFLGEFDLGEQNRNIGWDGIYALILTGRRDGGLDWRVGAHHISSHLGDEYIEATGRERLNITREEFLVGLGHRADGWRYYGEGAWAYHLGNHGVLDRWRLQGGAEHTWPRAFGRDALDGYLGLDVSTYQENDWTPNTTLGWGILHRGSPHLPPARIGFELYTGRVRMAEFFDLRETVLAFGLWL